MTDKKSSTNSIDSKLVKHIAQLANIPLKEQEAPALAQAFNETLEVVDELQKVDTKNIEQTHQVTGIENRFREDEVDQNQMFSQQQALANAKHTHDGYFVVNRLIDKE